MVLPRLDTVKARISELEIISKKKKKKERERERSDHPKAMGPLQKI